MDSPFPSQRIAELAGAKSARLVEVIQSLWSGYGQLVRVELTGADCESVIAKIVSPPTQPQHRYGWSGDASHLRKLKSYQVELNWYQNFSQRCDRCCRVANFLAGQAQEYQWLIILEDLDAAGFPIRTSSASDAQFDAVLSWLANFHATFLHDSNESAASLTDGIWPVGTYWYLDTRQDELAAMTDAQLKRMAPLIDRHLNRARFQTIVHGDAKLANFCFGDDDQVAAVDFQYVGGGCGMKDLAYFVSSCFGDRECQHREADLLDAYFRHLKIAVETKAAPVGRFDALEQEWRDLYRLAWADFYRFLSGWSPGHWKIHGYSQQVTAEVVQRLKQQSDRASD